MTIDFTYNEIENYLHDNSFEIKTVQCYKYVNTYNDKVLREEFDVTVAYRKFDAHLFNNEDVHCYDSVLPFKVENVFVKEMKNKLLNI